MNEPWEADAIEDFSGVHVFTHSGAGSGAEGEGVCYPGPKLFPAGASQSAVPSLKCGARSIQGGCWCHSQAPLQGHLGPLVRITYHLGQGRPQSSPGVQIFVLWLWAGSSFCLTLRVWPFAWQNSALAASSWPLAPQQQTCGLGDML